MLSATPDCPWHPSPQHCWQWGALCLPTMLRAGLSPGVPKASLCPPHLLTLLILPQVECPFGQGQPILVDLGTRDRGSRSAEGEGALLAFCISQSAPGVPGAEGSQCAGTAPAMGTLVPLFPFC